MKINFGIIGSGKIVEKFLDASIKNSEVNLYSFCSRSQDKVDLFIEKYGFEKGYTSFEMMLKDEMLDAVYIATPNNLHYSQTVLALQHGKHVLIEKPFSSNSQEAVEMIQEAKKRNLVLMEAMRPTLVPNFNQIKNHLHKLGKIKLVTTQFCSYSSSYEDYLKGENPNVFNLEMSGGGLMDVGIYPLAVIMHLFGNPEEVKAIAVKSKTGADIQGQVILDYRDFFATAMYSKASTSYMQNEIQGEKASLLIDKISGIRKIEIKYADGTTEDISVAQETNDMVYEIEEFVQVIKSDLNESQVNTLKKSLEIISVVEEIRKDLGIRFQADK